MNRIYTSIAFVCLVAGIEAQEAKPLFVKGNQLQPEAVTPTPQVVDDGSWRGKKFWFVPNPKTPRSWRVGFASSLSMDDLEQKALLYPMDVVAFTVVGIRVGSVPARTGDQSVSSDVEFYKVKFEDGSYAYLMKRDSSYKVSKKGVEDMDSARSYNNDLDLLSADPNQFTPETFFREDPRLMLKRYQAGVAATNTKVAAEAKAAEKSRKASAAAWKARGGIRIGMSKAQVIASTWGRPSSINRTVTANVVNEQWVYGEGNYLYFVNGILTSYQD